MPLWPIKFCIGKENKPCKFSLSLAGEPRIVKARSCEFCAGTIDQLSSCVINSLALFFILDYDIYKLALDRVDPSIRPECRIKVTTKLRRMVPNGCVSMVRRDRALMAIGALVQELKFLPYTMSKLKAQARVMHNAAFLKKRLSPELLYLVLAHAVGLKPHVSGVGFQKTKQYAYSLCRHPAFSRPSWHNADEDEESLPDIYYNTVELHQRALPTLKQALNRHASTASKLGWAAYARGAREDLGIIASIEASPLLEAGAPLCHRFFHPQQVP
jgi:hypothetical protein